MNDDRVQEIYGTLEKLVIELDRDPAARGPGYLQDLISKTRGYLNRASFFLTEVLRELHEEEMDLEALEAEFGVTSDDLMANNRQVSTLPAIQDRLAMVNVMLSAQRREILAKKRILKNLGHVERVIRHRHKELENTMSAIRLQRSLLETEIRTGAFYGDESDQSRGTRWNKTTTPDDDDMSGDEIERLLREATEEAETAAEDATPVALEAAVELPVPSVGVEDADISEMLAAAGMAGGAQDVVAPPVQAPNGSGPVEEADPDIRRFLSQEEDDADLFKDL